MGLTWVSGEGRFGNSGVGWGGVGRGWGREDWDGFWVGTRAKCQVLRENNSTVLSWKTIPCLVFK